MTPITIGIKKFKHPKLLFPVIHVEDLDQTRHNIEVAENAGSDGVFLISMTGDDEALFDILCTVQSDTKIWKGVNFLGLGVSMIDRGPFSGFWLDDGNKLDSAVAQRNRNIYRDMITFGGVAFKYQRNIHPDELHEACVMAMPLMDVITTSGSGTGYPPTVSKIKAMRVAIGRKPLAIASGISAANVEDFLPYTDAFLVASSINDQHGQLNYNKTKELARIIHDYH